MMKDILTFLCDCGPRKFEIRGKFHYLTNLYNKFIILFLKLSEDIFSRKNPTILVKYYPVSITSKK